MTRRERGKRPPKVPEFVAVFGPLATPTKSTLEPKLVRWPNAPQRGILLDLRRYFDTPTYSGASFRGVSLTRAEFDDLLRVGPAILAAWDRAEGGGDAAQAGGPRGGG